MPANVLSLCLDVFLNLSGYLLGLLHGCCTDVTVCIRTRSGMIVIRPAAWSPLCEFRVRSVPRGQQSMSPSAKGEVGANEDRIPDCKECSSNCEDAPSVTCTLN